jgi:hypothetical protein
MFLPVSAFGKSYQVAPGLQLAVELPHQEWQVSKTAPDFLVDQRAMHIHDDMMKRFEKKGIKTKKAAAEFQLKANELFIYYPQTKAYLEVDFSELRKDEKAPSKRSIALSAKYTGEELEHEEGLSQVRQKSSKSHIDGAKHTYRVDAQYLKHGEAKRFVGLIGFANRHWFYLYFTIPEGVSQVLPEVEEILRSITISN